jgi:predicted RNase H-like HicB family nuclease
MNYNVLIQPFQENQYQATVLNWPELSVTGKTEQVVLENIQQEILLKLNQGKIIQLQLPAINYRISPTTARRRVSRLVISELGNLLYGDEPVLQLNLRPCWRVPIMLAYPDRGPVGQVGMIEVDIETGELLVTEKLLDEIKNNAQQLAIAELN